jgi:hypothetical protein
MPFARMALIFPNMPCFPRDGHFLSMSRASEIALFLLHRLPSVKWPLSRPGVRNMCAMFRRGTLFRATLAIAFVAVLTFLAPPLAMAFVPSKETVHCLTHNDHGFSPKHHHQSIVNQNSARLEQERHTHDNADFASRCCEIFCVTALAPELRQVISPPLMGSERFPNFEPGSHSLRPELPFRPPILPLSI